MTITESAAPAVTKRRDLREGALDRSSSTPCAVVFALAGRGDSESSELEPRRMVVRFPDSHQLFVGNLPHDIDESELKDFFMSTFLTKGPFI